MTSVQFISIAEARVHPGLRMVLTPNWGFWSECAKAVLRVKGIDFVGVRQLRFSENRELVEWTGVRNQPQAIFENEPVRTNWLEILNLAERLQPEPALVPRDPAERVEAIGLCELICGQGGFAWQRRLHLAALDPTDDDYGRIMRSDYGLADTDPAVPEAAVAAILRLLAGRLHRQAQRGSGYLVGDTLSAADLYWACASNMVGFLPAEKAHVPEPLRERLGQLTPELAKAMDPILFEHRDRICDDWFDLPLTYD